MMFLPWWGAIAITAAIGLVALDKPTKEFECMEVCKALDFEVYEVLPSGECDCYDEGDFPLAKFRNIECNRSW